MSNNAGEVLIAGTGSISAAPAGTALPANESSALNAAFVDLGYTTEDGCKFTAGTDTTEIQAWQSKSPVRRFATGRSMMTVFELLQWNTETLQVALGGGVVSQVTGGHWRYDPPADADPLAEFSFVIQFVDGAKVSRLVIPRLTLADNTEFSMSKSKASTLPVSAKALAAPDGKLWYLLTNDPQLAQLS